MKREELFQFPLKTDCSLREILEPMDVIALQGMCFYIQLQEESLEDKDMLLEQIVNTLPGAVNRFALSFDRERYQLFQTMLAQGGVISADKLSIRKVMALRDMGLAYPALQEKKQVLVIPRELQEILGAMDKKRWGEIAEYNTKLLQRAQGAIHFYGFVETEKFVQICTGIQPEDPWDNIYFLEVLYNAILYYGTIEPEAEGFRHKRFWNYEYIRNQQEKRKDKPDYKPFSPEMLQRVGKQNGLEWTLPMERLKQFLMREGNLSKTIAKREVESAWYEFNNGIPFEDVCHYLMDWHFSLHPQDMQETLSFYLLQVFCTMPQWLLKGYSFEERTEALKEEKKEEE